MLKIAGCILIFAGCTSLGFIKSFGLCGKAAQRVGKTRFELIRPLAVGGDHMQTGSSGEDIHESVGAKTMLVSDVLHSCSLCMKEQRPLADSWEAALSENAKNCPLHERDTAVLRDIAAGLGRSDAKGQQDIIKPAVIRLETCLADAGEQEKKQGRMYRGLGMAAGAVIAVMLI